jgi:hypothetical protein
MVDIFAAPTYASTGVGDGPGDDSVAKFGGVLVTQMEMRRLAPGCWLSGDNIVAFARAATKVAGARASETFVVDTLFVTGTLLEAGVYSFANGRRYNPAMMDSARRLVVPLHVPVGLGGRNVHWAAALIDKDACTICVYDSLGSDRHKEGSLLQRFMADWEMRVYAVSAWGDGPRQTNEYDCGVYVCGFIEWMLMGWEWSATAVMDTEAYRRYILWRTISGTETLEASVPAAERGLEAEEGKVSSEKTLGKGKLLATRSMGQVDISRWFQVPAEAAKVEVPVVVSKTRRGRRWMGETPKDMLDGGREGIQVRRGRSATRWQLMGGDFSATGQQLQDATVGFLGTSPKISLTRTGHKVHLDRSLRAQGLRVGDIVVARECGVGPECVPGGLTNGDMRCHLNAAVQALLAQQQWRRWAKGHRCRKRRCMGCALRETVALLERGALVDVRAIIRLLRNRQLALGMSKEMPRKRWRV